MNSWLTKFRLLVILSINTTNIGMSVFLYFSRCGLRLTLCNWWQMHVFYESPSLDIEILAWKWIGLKIPNLRWKGNNLHFQFRCLDVHENSWWNQRIELNSKSCLDVQNMELNFGLGWASNFIFYLNFIKLLYFFYFQICWFFGSFYFYNFFFQFWIFLKFIFWIFYSFFWSFWFFEVFYFWFF
jgi:hypothetical protein